MKPIQSMSVIESTDGQPHGPASSTCHTARATRLLGSKIRTGPGGRTRTSTRGVRRTAWEQLAPRAASGHQTSSINRARDRRRHRSATTFGWRSQVVEVGQSDQGDVVLQGRLVFQRAVFDSAGRHSHRYGARAGRGVDALRQLRQAPRGSGGGERSHCRRTGLSNRVHVPGDSLNARGRW